MPSLNNRKILLRPVIGGLLAAFLTAAGIETAMAQSAPQANAAASSERQGVTRHNLQRHDLGLTGREVVQSVVSLEPGASFPSHRHPGEEAIYVLSGTFVYELEGQAPVTVGPGEAIFIPAGVAHSARNVGTGTASELATHIVEKGRPLLSLAE
jgi:quercetin dioxygenase-like cupin family protein